MKEGSKKEIVDLYAVVGNPIAHSMSPEIHNLFADQTGESIRYEKILVEHEQFAETVKEFFSTGGKGLNVTLPFKTDAFEFTHEHTEFAEHAGAVNTIIQQSNESYLGANTDGIGLLRDLKKTLRLQLSDKNILIIGGGGATQGIVEPLLIEFPAELIIANRTLSKAQSIEKKFYTMGNIQSCSLSQIPIKQYDLILHATSASLSENNLELPDEIVSPNTCCYDLSYGDVDTPFMQWANNLGAAVVTDGFGMLLEQAAESFYLWRGKRPDTTMALNYFRPKS